MSASVLGRYDWDLGRDKDGHRDYSVKYLVEVTDPDDGPVTVMNAPALPAVGATYAVGNDVDLWAFCQPQWKIAPVVTKEPNLYWTVDIPFSTRPLSRCQDDTFEDPLVEPDRVGGSFIKYMEAVTHDRHGNRLRNSAWEPLRGPLTEFDRNRPSVFIEKNLSSLPLATFAPMVDTVNDATLWGLDPRMVKLSNVSWRRQLYGTCSYYYVVAYEFEVDYRTFDRKVQDEGTRVFIGTDRNNPKHYKSVKDLTGENQIFPLDGTGKLLAPAASPVIIDIEFYEESNFLTLGIPSSF